MALLRCNLIKYPLYCPSHQKILYLKADLIKNIRGWEQPLVCIKEKPLCWRQPPHHTKRHLQLPWGPHTWVLPPSLPTPAGQGRVNALSLMVKLMNQHQQVPHLKCKRWVSSKSPAFRKLCKEWCCSHFSKASGPLADQVGDRPAFPYRLPLLARPFGRY